MRARLILGCLFLLAGCTTYRAGPEPPAPVEAVEYRSRADTVRGLLHRPPGGGKFPALVLVHGDFGLTGWEKEQALRLRERGYVVLAVDLYRGETVANAMEAHIMERGLPEDRVLADLKAAVDYLAGRPDVDAGRLGVIGWDIGAGYALDAAIQDARLRAAVLCYGRLTTDPALLAPLKASVLGIYAGKDEGITLETVEQFRAAMQKAGKTVAGLHTYPECEHGFMNPSSPHPTNPAPRETIADAWTRIENYLAQELKP